MLSEKKKEFKHRAHREHRDKKDLSCAKRLGALGVLGVKNLPCELEELLLLNKRGIIPGPEETDEAFWKRAEMSSKTYAAWQETHNKTSELFDFCLDWVEIFYSRKSLPFWQGALTWLDEIPKIQLHPRFKKGALLKIYRREEVLAHEAVHAARSQFFESKFEEHLAYLTAKNGRHRFFGPFFRTSRESTLFLALLALSTIAGFFGFTLFSLLSCLALSIGLARLALSHRIFNRCKRKLSLLKNPRAALSIMLRLTDAEIATFAKSSLDEIRDFISREKNRSLRWKMLSAAYF
jgi:hypothetical protein